MSDEFIGDIQADDDDGTVLLAVTSDGSYTATYGALTHTFRAKPRDAPSSPSVVITSVLPDPIGNDRDLEEVELKNNVSEPVDLTGWFLRDASERVWELSSTGAIEGNQTVVVVRAGMAMSLENDGDQLDLLNGLGEVVDRFEYTAARPGERPVR